MENRKIGLHTLLLLDIKVKEQSIENMARGRLIYEPPRYMDIATAAQQLLEIESIRQEQAYTQHTVRGHFAIGITNRHLKPEHCRS